MGRAEIRKQRKYVSKKLSDEQYKKLTGEVNKEYIEKEVESRVDWFKNLFSECLIESFDIHKIPKSKALMIIDDVSNIMQRKVEEKKNGKA